MCSDEDKTVFAVMNDEEIKKVKAKHL